MTNKLKGVSISYNTTQDEVLVWDEQLSNSSQCYCHIDARYPGPVKHHGGAVFKSAGDGVNIGCFIIISLK